MATIRRIIKANGLTRQSSRAIYDIYYQKIAIGEDMEDGIRLYIGNNPSSIVTAISLTYNNMYYLIDIFTQDDLVNIEGMDAVMRIRERMKREIRKDLEEKIRGEVKAELEEEYRKRVISERKRILDNFKGYQSKVFKLIRSFKEDTTKGEINGANWTAEVNGETIIG